MAIQSGVYGLINQALNKDCFDEAVDLLEQHPEHVNDRFRSSQSTPLLIFLKFRASTPQVQALIKLKAGLNYADQKNRTFPLLQAATDRDFHIMKVLAEAKADLNQENCEGLKTLDMALRSGNMLCARLLLDSNVDINAPNKNGQATLHSAAREHSVKGANLLIRNKADVNQTDNKNNTPLIEALAHEHGESYYALALSLLNANATTTINHKNNEGKSALSMASRIRLGHDVVRLLIENGADTDTQMIKEANALAKERAEEEGPLAAKELSLTPAILKEAFLAKVNKLMKVLTAEVTS